LGLNTGIQDASNLVWKLDFALRRSSSAEDYNVLLDTYDTERRPIGRRVGLTSLHSLRSHSDVMDRALGVVPSNSVVENVAAMNAFLDPTSSGGNEKRKAVVQAQKVLDNEFHALGAEVGWFYPDIRVDEEEDEGTVSRHGGQLLENGVLDCINYHLSTIPGHHLPHVWLRKKRETGGARVSTRDLVERDRFLLLTRDMKQWKDFARDLVHVEGICDGTDTEKSDDYVDVDGRWAKLCGVSKTGAVLVRPDGIVAWRARDSDGMSLERMQDVLRRILKLNETMTIEGDGQESGQSVLAKL